MNKIINILKVKKKTNILINKEEIESLIKILSNFFRNIYFYSKINIKKISKFFKKKTEKIYIYKIKNKKKKNSYYIYADENIQKKKNFYACLYYNYNYNNNIYIKFSTIKKILKIKTTKKKKQQTTINSNFINILNNTENYFAYFGNLIISKNFLSYKNIKIFSKMLYLYNKYRIINIHFFLILIKYERLFVQKI